MTKMIMLRNPNDDMQDKLNKFWTSLSAWMDQQEVIVPVEKAAVTVLSGSRRNTGCLIFSG